MQMKVPGDFAVLILWRPSLGALRAVQRRDGSTLTTVLPIPAQF